MSIWGTHLGRPPDIPSFCRKAHWNTLCYWILDRQFFVPLSSLSQWNYTCLIWWGFFFLYKHDPINTRALLHTCWSRSTNPSVPDLQRLYVCHLLGRWHQCQGQAHKRSSSCWLNEGFVVVRDVKVWMGEGLRAGEGERVKKEPGSVSMS